jgi:hypothetical protein
MDRFGAGMKKMRKYGLKRSCYWKKSFIIQARSTLCLMLDQAEKAFAYPSICQKP